MLKLPGKQINSFNYDGTAISKYAPVTIDKICGRLTGMLTENDRTTFQDSGLILLKGFAPKKQLAKVQELIEKDLIRLKLKAGGKYNTAKLQQMPVFQQTTYLSGQVQVGDDLNGLFTDDLIKVIEDLSQSKINRVHPQPQLLLSFPHKEEWNLKNLNWHLDYKNSRMDIMPGIQVFILIDDVLPKGGATLALAGSHRLHKVVLGQNANGLLKANVDFTGHPEKFTEPQMINGIPVQIIEMSGKAGDVYLMDLRVLHTPSINAQKHPRIMTTNRYLKPGLRL